jgi:Flp pilus assembly protein TadG
MKKPKLILEAPCTNNCGATAVEFALIAPALVTVVVGTFYLCMALYLVASMHFAVEDGARCASVNSTTCGSASAIVTYTKGRYFGPNTPTFAYATAACGNSVSASVTYVANLGVTSVSIPITAKACYP